MSKIKFIYMKNIYEIECKEKYLYILNLLYKYFFINYIYFN